MRLHPDTLFKATAVVGVVGGIAAVNKLAGAQDQRALGDQVIGGGFAALSAGVIGAALISRVEGPWTSRWIVDSAEQVSRLQKNLHLGPLGVRVGHGVGGLGVGLMVAGILAGGFVGKPDPA